MTVPGRVFPQMVAVQVAVTIAVNLNMLGETLDVSAAVLLGLPIERSMDIRAPSCGMPALRECANIRPGQLLPILTGPCGLKGGSRIVVPAIPRASDGEGDSDLAPGRRIIVWYKIRSNLPASEIIDQYLV